MTYQSEIIIPNIEESGGVSRRDRLRRQVMAADEEDDMEWLDYEEQMQYLRSDEDNAEYEFPKLEMGFELRDLERDGVSAGGEIIPRQRRQPQARVRGLARPLSLTKTQRKQH